MRTASDSLFARILGVIVCLSLAFPARVPGPDMPAGAGTPKVVHGGANFQRSGDNLTVTTRSDRTIINWDRFSVPGGSATHFAQPGVNSATLNRVQGDLPTRVDGVLSSNGAVYITNAYGVVVGPGGVVRTDGGFVASSLGISNADFLGGGPDGTSSMRFGHAGYGDGAVENHGLVESSRGDVFLLGTRVVNTGRVSAANGTAGLAAGRQVVIHPLGNPGGRVEIIATEASFAEGAGVDNAGVVAAAAAELRAHGNAYRLAVNNTGVVEARGVSRTPEGRVFLTGHGRNGAAGSVVNAGSVRALNADGSGGAAYITGEAVTLASGSLVDVSAESGAGGTALVGGAFQGGKHADGAELLAPNARELTVEDGAEVLADGAGAGDGGLAVLWADGHTEYAGHVSARGGHMGGDGGLAEVSGKKTLRFAGTADTTGGAGGKTGTLLLDPQEVTIGFNSGTISSSDLTGALNSSNVVVHTSMDGAYNGESGNIFVDAIINWHNANSLTLLAWNNIILTYGINSMAGGDLTLVAGWNGSAGLTGAGPNYGFTLPTLPTSQADLATAPWFGDASDRPLYSSTYAGSIVLSPDPVGEVGVSVGSCHGATTLLANEVALLGGTNTNQFAHIGYKAENSPPADPVKASGDLAVYARKNITLKAGSGANAYVQVGDGGGLYDPNSYSNDATGYTLDTSGASITILSGGTLFGSGGSGINSYAKFGHGGSVVNDKGVTLKWADDVSDADMDVVANVISLTSGDDAFGRASVGAGLTSGAVGNPAGTGETTGLSSSLTIRTTGGGVLFTPGAGGAGIVHAGSGEFALLSPDSLVLPGQSIDLRQHTGAATLASGAGLRVTGGLFAGGNLFLLAGAQGITGGIGDNFDPGAATVGGTTNALSINDELTVSGGLTARAGGDIAVNGAVSSGKSGYFQAKGDVTLGSGGKITSNAGDLFVEAGGKFVNDSASADQALAAGKGRWLVWTADAANSKANGLSPSAATRQFGVDAASNAVTVASPDGAPTITRTGVTLSGNGFLLQGDAPTINLKVENASMIYGNNPDNNWSFDRTFTGTILGDTPDAVLASVDLSGATPTTDADNRSKANGVYYTSIEGLSGSSLGYGIKVDKGVMTVAKRPVTVTATGTSVYGDKQGALSFVDPNDTFVNIGNLSGALDVNVTKTSDAGKYTISVSDFKVTGLDENNFSISFDGTDGYEVTPRPVSVAPGDLKRQYGDENPSAGAFTVAGLVNGDALAGEADYGGANSRSNAGDTFVIGQGTVNNASNPNYDITWTGDGNLTIVPREITFVTKGTVETLYSGGILLTDFELSGGSLANGDETVFGGETLTGDSVAKVARTIPKGVYQFVLASGQDVFDMRGKYNEVNHNIYESYSFTVKFFYLDSKLIEGSDDSNYHITLRVELTVTEPSNNKNKDTLAFNIGDKNHIVFADTVISVGESVIDLPFEDNPKSLVPIDHIIKVQGSGGTDSSDKSELLKYVNVSDAVLTINGSSGDSILNYFDSKDSKESIIIIPEGSGGKTPNEEEDSEDSDSGDIDPDLYYYIGSSGSSGGDSGDSILNYFDSAGSEEHIITLPGSSGGKTPNQEDSGGSSGDSIPDDTTDDTSTDNQQTETEGISGDSILNPETSTNGVETQKDASEIPANRIIEMNLDSSRIGGIINNSSNVSIDDSSLSSNGSNGRVGGINNNSGGGSSNISISDSDISGGISGGISGDSILNYAQPIKVNAPENHSVSAQPQLPEKYDEDTTILMPDTGRPMPQVEDTSPGSSREFPGQYTK